MSRAQKIGFAIWLLVIAAAIADMVYETRRADSAASWRSAEGRVIESGFLSSAGGRTHAPAWHPYVHYQYRANGRMLTGARIWLSSGLDFDSQASVEDFLRPYPPGAPLQVFYNPAKPADSALIVENFGPMMILIVFIGLISLVVTWYWPRMVAASERARARAQAARANQT